MTVFMIHFVCCTFMVGLIWTIQIVHYPSFHYVALDQFNDFHNFHSRRITYVVLPIMGVELISGLSLVFLFSQSRLLLFNLGFLIVIWGSTFFMLVPLHNQLSKQREAVHIQSLVLANWVRTALWTLRLMLLCLFLFDVGHVDLSVSR